MAQRRRHDRLTESNAARQAFIDVLQCLHNLLAPAELLTTKQWQSEPSDDRTPEMIALLSGEQRQGDGGRRAPRVRANIAVKSRREIDHGHRILDWSSENAQLQSHAATNTNPFNSILMTRFREALHRIQRYPSTEVNLSLNPDILDWKFEHCRNRASGLGNMLRRICCVFDGQLITPSETMLCLQLPMADTIRPCLVPGSRWMR